VLELLRAAGKESDPDYEALEALLAELLGTKKRGKVSRPCHVPPEENLLHSDPRSLLSDQFWPTHEVRMQKQKRKPKGQA
jgi:hypothetical protein